MTLQVFTWREGLLARVGHDLRLSAPARITREGEAVVVTVDAASLHVDGAMKDGRLTEVSAGDRADIEKALRTDVLNVARHPQIRWRGTMDGRGTLELCGRSAPLRVPAKAEGDRMRGEVEFAPSAWGIKPFRALLGALKLQDRVRVVFDGSV